ncbi:MAG: TOBE domain-containing protein [Bacteroidota bacterium]
MNKLEGKIESISVKGSLSLVMVNVNNTLLTTIVIDNPETSPYLKEEKPVKVIFKETEVIIGKGEQNQISLQNKFKGKIDSIDTGELLCKININTSVGKIASIITANAVRKLDLKPGTEVTAMIKTNEMMLSK